MIFEPAVIVIAKAPEPGRVKTRCCPPCTPQQAAALAAAALADTLAAVDALSDTRTVIVLDGEPGPWLGVGRHVIPQRGRGLGARIDNAFADVGVPALLIGMDTPQVTTAMLEDGLARLRGPKNDAVVGPAADGGFWALGLAAPADGLCADVPMSTPTTRVRLYAALRRRSRSWSELPLLVDVDDFCTAGAVAAAIPGSRLAAVVDDIAATIGVGALGAAG